MNLRTTITAITTSILAIGVFLGAGSVSTVFAQQFSATYGVDERLYEYAAPAIVRVVTQYTGAADIAPFVMDLSELTVTKGEDSGSGGYTVDVRELLVGTGVVVNPNGTILTHPVFTSDKGIKIAIVAPLIADAISTAQSSSDEEIELNEQEIIDYTSEAIEFVIENSTFDIAYKVYVVPTFAFDTEGLQIEHLTPQTIAQDAIPAAVIDTSSSFYSDGDNLSLLQIQGTFDSSLNVANGFDLPSLVRYITFPPKTVPKPSDNILQGDVSKDIKVSTKEGVQVLDTEIPVSLIGSPVFTADGFAGIMTYNLGSGAEGGVPVSLVSVTEVQDYLDSLNIEAQDGTYQALLRSMHIAYESGQCSVVSKLADDIGELASSAALRGDLKSYKTSCVSGGGGVSDEELVVDSGATNSTTGVFLENTLFVAVVLLTLVLIGLFLWWTIKRSKERVRDNQVESYDDLMHERVYKAPPGATDPISATSYDQSSKPAPREDSVQNKSTSTAQVEPMRPEKETSVKTKKVVGSDMKRFIQKEAEVDKPHSQNNVRVGDAKTVTHAIERDSGEMLITTKDSPEASTELPTSAEDEKILSELWPETFATTGEVDRRAIEVQPQEERAAIGVELSKLIQYIESARVHGIDDATIHQQLLAVGWSSDIVSAAFAKTTN